MMEFISYLLESSVYLVVFFIIYRILLSKMSFFAINRFSLLGLICLSVLLPLLHLSTSTPIEEASANISQFTTSINTINNTQQFPTATNSTKSIIGTIVILFYLTGVIFFGVRMLVGIIRLTRIIYKHPYTKTSDNIKLVIHNEKLAPMSWMNYIFISKSDYQYNKEEVITHEKAHNTHHHTYDTLLMELIFILQWFNPAAWLLKKELELVHEYQADNEVIKQGINAKTYQLLLIKKTVGIERFKLANSLNKDFLQKRITMMLKKKTNKFGALRITLMVSAYLLIAITIPNSLQARSIVSKYFGTIELLNFSKATALEESSIPQVKGGTDKLSEFLAENSKYPKEAVRNKEQGRVLVQFSVNQAGKCINTQIIQSASPSLDSEALRLIKLIPEWESNNNENLEAAIFILPMRFIMKSVEPISNSKTNVDLKSIKGNILNEIFVTTY